MKRCDGYLFGGIYDEMFGIEKQKIIVYDTPGFGDSDMAKVSNIQLNREVGIESRFFIISISSDRILYDHISKYIRLNIF